MRLPKYNLKMATWQRELGPSLLMPSAMYKGIIMFNITNGYQRLKQSSKYQLNLPC